MIYIYIGLFVGGICMWVGKLARILGRSLVPAVNRVSYSLLYVYLSFCHVFTTANCMLSGILIIMVLFVLCDIS